MPNPAPQDRPAGPLVAQAVERMAAAKIAVGLPPLALLGLYGLVESVRGGLRPADPAIMLIGALLSMVAMVAYGLQAVSTVLERTSRWSGLIFAGSFVPLLFAGYVIVTRVLFLLPAGGTTGLGPMVLHLVPLVLAAMCARAQWKLIEVHLLAREMAGVGSVGLDPGGP